MPPAPKDPDDSGITLREHSFDGIEEYDQRLPNWWLYTLYGAIVFWIGYWALNMSGHLVSTPTEQVDAALTRIAATRLASSIDVSNDDKFWAMSANPVFVESGRQTFAMLCTPCHLASMRGKSENPAAVGPDLTDTAWIHGGTPKEIFNTVSKGVLAKGMPSWEPILGQKKTTEVVAYVLSCHHKGEPIIVQGSN